MLCINEKNLLTIEEKDALINDFIKKLIQKNIINIFKSDNSINEDLVYQIYDNLTEVFTDVAFVKGIEQEYEIKYPIAL